MFCEQCGTKINEGEQFCPNCGMKISIEEITTPQIAVHSIPVKKVKRVCTTCGKNLDQDWVICPYCKTEIVERLCVNCKKELESDWLACPYCKTEV